ncbi:hypothetical protein JG687_00015334 [Phytophthora cactorum]|uniref:Uncharacterized protein n=1 Tax=Phytophthora cactorum TaxID=29920 RepID=A0A8T1TTN3_9STRA|nr:hypothetical protein JG687_00015334 [Phytophthora cactorum]
MASKFCLGGQGQPCVFPHTEVLVQWIKAMPRDDFLLKMSHVVAFVKEEYEVWILKYLEASKEASLYRLLQLFVRRHGYSFGARLRLEQEKFARDTGDAVTKIYCRQCIFNADRKPRCTMKRSQGS